MWNTTNDPYFNKDEYDNNIDKRIMERDNMFNYDSKMDMHNDKIHNIPDFSANYITGEITGEAYDILSTDQGMPLRSINTGITKENISLLDSSLKYNPHLDFDLYDTTPKIDVQYYDPVINNKANFSVINGNMEIFSPKNISVTIINDFSIYMLHKVVSSFNKSNVLSPFGILLSINMLYRGSKSDTERELRTSLNLPDKDTSFSSFKNILENIQTTGLVTLSTNIFVSDDISINKAYVHYISPIGNIRSINMSFSEKSSININNIINLSTNGLINNVINQEVVKKSNHIILTSCQHIKSNWKIPFFHKKTKILPFYSFNSKRMEYLMQLSDTNNMYYEDEQCQLLEKSLDDSNIVIGFYLPKKYDNIDINYEYLHYIIKRLADTYINCLVIPKFKLCSRYEITRLLRNMGIDKLFTSADLDDIFITDKNICVDNIIHKVCININEGRRSSQRDSNNNVNKNRNNINFIANHPFIYYVRHISTDSLVSIGIFR